MATDKEGTVEQQNLEFRRAIQSAYTTVQAAEASRGLGSVTYEELMQQQVDMIEGSGTDTRPSILQRIDRVEADILAVVGQVKELPVEYVLQPNGELDANTAP
jgi:hypothetical protein